ncbi:MAG TPA: sigma-70 region 4 domain-containing protein [Stenotrophomonas sp.]|jgi:hypothetical protein
MTTRPDPGASPPPAALSAFIRGVERRGDVLARLQCGDTTQAERALAAALRAFRSHAGAVPMAVWPLRFWSLLSAVPALREPAGPQDWPAGVEPLGEMSPGDRLALLLRVVAGLDEPAAAEVLGLDESQYQQALARACPRDATGRPDAQAWRALADAAQQALRDLGPDRLVRLAQLREAALGAGAMTMAPAGPVVARPAHARKPTPPRTGAMRWRRWWTVGVLGLLLLAVAGWLAWRGRMPDLPPEPVSQAPAGALHVVDNAPVLVEELPAEDLPETTPIAGPDPADVAMQADPQLALARQADFYAWFAAGGPIPPDESESQPVRTERVAAGLQGADLETADDP